MATSIYIPNPFNTPFGAAPGAVAGVKAPGGEAITVPLDKNLNPRSTGKTLDIGNVECPVGNVFINSTAGNNALNRRNLIGPWELRYESEARDLYIQGRSIDAGYNDFRINIGYDPFRIYAWKEGVKFENNNTSSYISNLVTSWENSMKIVSRRGSIQLLDKENEGTLYIERGYGNAILKYADGISLLYLSKGNSQFCDLRTDGTLSRLNLYNNQNAAILTASYILFKIRSLFALVWICKIIY